MIQAVLQKLDTRLKNYLDIISSHIIVCGVTYWHEFLDFAKDCTCCLSYNSGKDTYKNKRKQTSESRY